MGDSETEYIVELQPKVAERLEQLGFNDTGHRDILAHGLAEVASRSRTFDQQALPLFLSLDIQHRRALAEVTVALKNHLDAMQDSICDMRGSLAALTDFLLGEDEQPGNSEASAS